MAEYAWYGFARDWPELVTAVNELEIRLRTNGRPDAANLLLRAYGILRDEMLALADRMAVFATEELRKAERDTRVRPDTQGGGGPRLGDHLIAQALPQQDLMPGSIGVANEDVLDAGVPWWITNEVGSSARVGQRLFGFFYGADDEAPPLSNERGFHPLFQAGPGPVSGGGIIEEPIPARYFIAKAAQIVAREWSTAFDTIYGRFLIELRRAIATPR